MKQRIIVPHYDGYTAIVNIEDISFVIGGASDMPATIIMSNGVHIPVKSSMDSLMSSIDIVQASIEPIAQVDLTASTTNATKTG
jgi:hypothetical protein